MRPERAKALILLLLPFQGVIYTYVLVPRALPWADSFLPLRGVPSPEQSHLALSADNIEGADNDEKLLADSNSFLFIVVR